MRLDEMSWIVGNQQKYISGNTATLFGVASILTTIYLIYKYVYGTKGFPIMGKPSDPDFRLAMIEGVSKYPNSPFFLPTKPPVLIAPKSAVSLLKSIKDDEASFTAAIRDQFHPKVTGVGDNDPLLVTVVKSDISRQVASSLKFLQDEAAYSFNDKLGPCEDWTSIVLYPKLAEIVALISSRIFVGRPLSRNKDWVDVTVNYTFEVMKAKNAIPKWPEWIISILGPHIKEVKSLHKFRERATVLMKPILDAQLAKTGNEKLFSIDGDEEGNGIAWILAHMEPEQRRDPKVLANQLLALSFAAIHTTTNTTSQAILDLAAYRQYIPILMEEIDKVILEDGYETSEDGVLRLRKSSMPKLSKLDSFLKESQRVNPLSLVSHLRRTITDVNLPSGHTIPKGIKIAIPAWYIHNNSDSLFSPGITKPLDEFDGLRFYNLRKLPGNENRHQFVSTSYDSLSFGHGNHACPGRFFAGNEIKVIMIELMRNWDFRLPGDNKLEGGAWRRPRNKHHQIECRPDPNVRIEFRKKKH
ncbi:Cytochrome P450 monooxygenase ascG [Erysiphe necator]|uniref:Putative cytochrome p450 monooxygenase n=1 Tax=Uncinula necator TaxID=52586 RepID=A0A0B1PAR8_UNCNE|nr:Cytochrome P450 monooxygenase ascG [Erysiphe necator]KHJ34071.1 putative cytochrome p450 monooxygenase [Erysiphe necator]